MIVFISINFFNLTFAKLNSNLLSQKDISIFNQKSRYPLNRKQYVPFSCICFLSEQFILCHPIICSIQTHSRNTQWLEFIIHFVLFYQKGTLDTSISASITFPISSPKPFFSAFSMKWKLRTLISALRCFAPSLPS